MQLVLLENSRISSLPEDEDFAALRDKYDSAESLYRQKANEAHLRWLELKAKWAEYMTSATDENEKEEYLSQMKEIDAIHNQREERRRSKYQPLEKEYDLLKKYGETFAYLYKVKHDNDTFGEGVKIDFEEISLVQPTGGIMSNNQHNLMSADGALQQLALKIQIDDAPEFFFSLAPSDITENRVKAQIIFDQDALSDMDWENSEAVAENKKKIRKIMDYLQEHGIEPMDFEIPYEAEKDALYEGKEKHLNSQQRELQQQFYEAYGEVRNDIIAEIRQAQSNEKVGREVEKRKLQKEISENSGIESNLADISLDPLPQYGAVGVAPKTEAIQSVANDREPQVIGNEVNAVSAHDGTQNSAQRAASTNQAAVASNSPKVQAVSLDKAVKEIEKFIQEGLAKKKDFSYWKQSKGLLNKSTYVFTLFDAGDTDKDKHYDDKGNLKYSAKVFIKKMNDGRIGFYWQTPDNKKLDEAIINGIAGNLKGLGFTHLEFPNGVKDAEKGAWRKALAENGIVPIGMAIDASKATGMVKAAEEKLSAERAAVFKYHLGMQMLKNFAAKEAKGSHIDDSDKFYAQGLVNSYYYRGFTNGLGDKLKRMMRDNIAAGNDDRQVGAVTKIATYTAMRRLFDIYDENLHADNIIGSRILTSDELRLAQSSGLTMPVQQMTDEQLGSLYNILMEKARQEAEVRIKHDLENEPMPRRSPKIILNDILTTAKNQCEGINDELKAKGVAEVKFPNPFGQMYYADANKYAPQQNQPQPQNPQPQKNGEKKTVLIEKSIKEQGNSIGK